MPQGLFTDGLAPISAPKGYMGMSTEKGDTFTKTISQPKFNAAATPASVAGAAPAAGGMSTNTKLGLIGIAQGGMEAATGPSSATTSEEAIVGALGAGATGALTGAAIGSVVPVIGTAVGAAVGGAVGLVFGGLNGFLSVKSSRKKAREAEKLRQEVIAREEKRRAEDQKFLQGQIDYNRSALVADEKYKKYQEGRSQVLGALQMNSDLKDRFKKFGY